MLCVEVCALIIGILYARRTLLGRLFVFYITFDLVVLILYWIFKALTQINEQLRSTIYVGNSLVSLFELLVYFQFFKHVINNRAVIKWMRFARIIFLMLVCLYLISMFSFISIRFRYISYLIGALEFCFLLPPCLVFYYQLLKTNSKLKLLERPSFWLVTGIFFYSLISIPYYLIDPFLKDNDYQLRYIFGALFFEVPCTLHFGFLLKAFLCKKPLTI
jgi:hypothetical protein